MTEAMVVATGATAGGVAAAATITASATHSAVEGSLTASAAAVHGMSRMATMASIIAVGVAPLAAWALPLHADDLPHALTAVSFGVLGYMAVRCLRHARTRLRALVRLPLVSAGYALVLFTG